MLTIQMYPNIQLAMRDSSQLGYAWNVAKFHDDFDGPYVDRIMLEYEQILQNTWGEPGGDVLAWRLFRTELWARAMCFTHIGSSFSKS